MFSELLAAVEDPSHDAVELCRQCLVLARSRRQDFEVAKNSETALLRSAKARKQMGAVLSAHSLPIDLTPAVRGEVRAVLESAVVGITPVLRVGLDAVLAHDLALALEETFGARFFDHLAAGGARELGPDDLLPLLSPFADREGAMRVAYYRDLAPRPTNLGLAPDALIARARLTPSVPHGARLRWVPSWSWIDELGPESLVAVLSPAQFSDLKLPHKESEIGGRFFGVCPRDPATHVDVARRLVEEADRAGAHVVVLPELCLDEPGLGAVADWVEQHATSIRVAVCGSAHREVQGDRQNVAFVAAPRHPDYARVEQPKVVPFVWRHGGKEYEEDIRRAGRVVSLLTGRHWSLLVMVCMDFIDRDLIRFAEDVRPTLVLVPACSETTGVFQASASIVASRAQGHVVVANQPVPGDQIPATAILARPRREGSLESAQSTTTPETHWANLAAGPWRRKP